MSQIIWTDADRSSRKHIIRRPLQSDVRVRTTWQADTEEGFESILSYCCKPKKNKLNPMQYCTPQYKAAHQKKCSISTTRGSRHNNPNPGRPPMGTSPRGTLSPPFPAINKPRTPTVPFKDRKTTTRNQATPSKTPLSPSPLCIVTGPVQRADRSHLLNPQPTYLSHCGESPPPRGGE
ncbi:hypothetical protein VTG60DRAFT_364 [Thermothelomyces hinnuleus]